MVNIREAQVIFIVVAVMGSSFIIYPVIQYFLPTVPGDSFTELYVLGSSHRADSYPYNVRVGDDNEITVTVVNHRGVSTYYLLQMKLRDMDENPPDTVNELASSVMAFQETPFLLNSDDKWEKTIKFSFPEAFLSNDSLIVPQINVDGNQIQLNKTLTESDGQFKGGLFFELLIYDENSSNFQYDNRFVEIMLNLSVFS